MPPDILSGLRDLHLPEAPGWWPPAPGWWLLAIFAIAFAVWLVSRIRQRVRERRPLRETLTELHALNHALRSGALTPMPYLDRVNALLKRLLIHAYGAREVAALSCDAWARALGQFLHRFSKPNALMRIETSLLGEFRYRPYSESESTSGRQQDLHAACERLGEGLERALRELNPPEAQA